MTNFILIDKTERTIRTDYFTGCLLIFETKEQAERHLKEVNPIKDRENTEIVEKVIKFESKDND